MIPKFGKDKMADLLLYLDEDVTETKECPECGEEMTLTGVDEFGDSFWECPECGYTEEA